jgi:5-(aminomethyl)-3-furanmethanol phosphate kinase
VSEVRLPPPLPLPLVVKVGGGLLRDEGLDGLRRACAEVNEIATRRPVLVVPGGGPFADAVRAVDAQVGLDDAIAHRLALQAMDQLGVLLAPLLTSAQILAVTTAFAGRPNVPASWSVTSDSLAVLTAGAIGAEEAVLLKPVAGVFARWPSDDPPLAQLTADELRALHDAGGGRGVDAFLPEAIRRTDVTVTVRAPGGLGTRISPR